MPRSSSRDVVDRFSGNRGYFHRSDSLRHWKNLLALGAVGLVFGWFVVELALPGRAASAHSHGELANPHAAFDSNCQACHRSHSAGDFLSNPASAFDAHSRWHDLTCTKCHAGPAHHAAVKDASFHEQCSNCHHDHQGRNVSLVRMDDRHCTKCHQNLPDAHSKGETTFAKSVTSFSGDHPEFRSLKVNRGLKFSHALHMNPGMVSDPQDRQKWTPELLGKRFGDAAGNRYRNGNEDATAPVQMMCINCHRLDSGLTSPEDKEAHKILDIRMNALMGAPRRAVLPPRAEGAYFLPVNYDVNCKACHPLKTAPATSGNSVVAEFNVPHRLQSNALRHRLRGEFATRLASGKNPILDAPLGPGGRLDPKASAEAARFGAELDRITDNTIRTLMQNLTPVPLEGNAPTGGFACGKCHYAAEPGKTDILPLPNKAVWMQHATFNHVSHRSLTCISCHPGTSGSFARDGIVNEREPVLISGVKSCRACHAEAGKTVDLPDGRTAQAAGIRHSCTDCHRYHNGDRPLQGLGSRWRDPVPPLNLDEFLRGGKE